jgi:hypothetical protein
MESLLLIHPKRWVSAQRPGSGGCGCWLGRVGDAYSYSRCGGYLIYPWLFTPFGSGRISQICAVDLLPISILSHQSRISFWMAQTLASAAPLHMESSCHRLFPAMRDQQTQQTSATLLKLFGGRRLRLDVLLAISLVSLGSCLETCTDQKK